MNDVYRKLMRWAALPVTDRRWAAPLSALALGFGLFVGVALSPNTAGTLAGSAPQVIELPSLLAEEPGEGDEETAEAVQPPPLAEAPLETFESEATESVVPSAPGDLPGAFEESAQPEETAEEEDPAEKSPDLTGTVIHVNPAAGSYTVAEEGGTMTAVHSSKLPAPGTEIAVPIRTLANGTLAEDGSRKAGAGAKQATLAGIVTFVDPTPAAPAYTVSNPGVSVLVHVTPDPAGAAAELPQLGAYATVTASIEVPAVPLAPKPPPTSPDPAAWCLADPVQAAAPPIAPKGVLWQRDVSAGGAPFTAAVFEGIVAGTCPQTGQVLISADDIRQSGRDLLFTVPPKVDPSKLKVGDSVLANASFEPDGSLSLTGLASDEQVKGANDPRLTQGDLVRAKEKR